VRVEAPARLHLGFIDVSGSLGRRFGSLGLTLEEFSTVLSLRRADRFDAQGPDAQRASAYLRRLLDDHDPPTSVALHVHRAIPEHVGLGSGTQLALAVGKAFGALFELSVLVATLAARLDRGACSGIGIGAFEEGGFVVDGGGAPPVPTPVISRKLSRAPGGCCWCSTAPSAACLAKQRGVPGPAGFPAATRGPPGAPGR
jgi:beta-RFAP synthase